MTDGVYLNSDKSISKFVYLVVHNYKKYQPTVFIDVVPAEYFNKKINGKINVQLKGIPVVKDALSKDEISIDDFATSLASKIQVSSGIFADYIQFHNLPKNLLDAPFQKIDQLFIDCENALKNVHNVPADIYYLRFREMIEPLKSVKKLLQDSLRQKGLIATDENDKVMYYAQELINLLEYSKKEFAAAPTKKSKPSINSAIKKR